jgi:hypothetical protein
MVCGDREAGRGGMGVADGEGVTCIRESGCKIGGLYLIGPGKKRQRCGGV